MVNKFINLISNKLSEQKEKHFLPHSFIIFLFTLPIIILAAISFLNAYSSLTKIALERRESIANIAGVTVSENLHHLTGIGISYASRVAFRRLITEGKWEEAIDIIKSIPKDFPVVERIFLADPQGILKTDFPPLPDVVGVNFSHRDWYKGVSREWQPYISEVYKRAAVPQHNVIAVATPIKSDEGIVLGILVMQVKIDSLFNLISSIKIGEEGFLYIVDQNNRLVIHPNFPPQGEIVDFNSVPAIQEMRTKGRGVIVAYNPVEKEKRVTAYQSVSKFGWGVVVQEPVKSAFADRNLEIIKLAGLYGILIILSILFAYLFLKIIHVTNSYRQKERILLDSIGDGVVAIDRFWNITLWNKSAENITGWKKEEVLGKPLRNFLRLIKEQNRMENIAFIEEAIVYGRVGFLESSTLLITKEGKEVSAGDSAAPIYDSSGTVIGAIIVFRDISAEKESFSLKSDFAYASHQLNTPVTKALWSLESVLDEEDIKKIKEKVNIAYQSTKSIQKLNTQLYGISEIDQNVIIPKYENVKLIDLIGEIDKNLKDMCKECNIILNVEPISPVLGIKTDPKILKRILHEVTENALIYNKLGGKVNLKTTVDANGLLFEISDSGIGIARDQEALIFTKFFRGNNFDTTEIVGAGLGLFIAQSYIKLLGGKIWFNSEKGKGTTFNILLPIK